VSPRPVILSLVALSLSSAAARADDGWKAAGTKNGVVYEKRTVSGSKFLEFRATMQVAVAPAEALQKIWSLITNEPPPSNHRRVIRRTDDEIVVYDQIDTPVVSDRDVTLRIYKMTRPEALEVRFESNEALGPPPDPKRVRLAMVRGAWTIETVPGGSRLTYLCYSEPGGSIPAFMVRGPQRDHVTIDVERVLARLRQQPEALTQP
jgi:hypothetical protein